MAIGFVLDQLMVTIRSLDLVPGTDLPSPDEASRFDGSTESANQRYHSALRLVAQGIRDETAAIYAELAELKTQLSAVAADYQAIEQDNAVGLNRLTELLEAGSREDAEWRASTGHAAQAVSSVAEAAARRVAGDAGDAPIPGSVQKG